MIYVAPGDTESFVTSNGGQGLDDGVGVGLHGGGRWVREVVKCLGAEMQIRGYITACCSSVMEYGEHMGSTCCTGVTHMITSDLVNSGTSFSHGSRLGIAPSHPKPQSEPRLL